VRPVIRSPLSLLTILLAGNAAAQTGPVDFTREVRPLLSRHCFACHGPDAEAREADLSLVDFESATRELAPDIFAIVPGDPDSSELWRRITDAGDPMPPTSAHDELEDSERRILRRWIEEGASFDPHWAYVPPIRTTEPPSRESIDSLNLRSLASAGLEPAPPADSTTLLRRVSLDLGGLPPTIPEIDAFIAGSSEEAYEAVVDRLLASDHFGERFATKWLDLVRYADTVGYHGDQEHHAWPYRDWVIRALNENMPFDRFTIEQLAGDLLLDAGQDQLIASGYNRLLQTTHEGGLQLKEYRAIYMADRVRNASEVWMGATLGCAQCHDHKYDPFTARDFHAFGAFFADIDDEEHLRKPYDGLNTTPTRRTPEMQVIDDTPSSRLPSKPPNGTSTPRLPNSRINRSLGNVTSAPGSRAERQSRKFGSTTFSIPAAGRKATGHSVGPRASNRSAVTPTVASPAAGSPSITRWTRPRPLRSNPTTRSWRGSILIR
jgi:mono/diheme cytochrome c family protein